MLDVGMIQYHPTMDRPSSIAHYRITAKLGEGGMGTVYRATDIKLNRDVAIKVISEAFAEDPAAILAKLPLNRHSPLPQPKPKHRERRMGMCRHSPMSS